MSKYLILVALLFCSCSQTTVHLYSRYLSDPQIEAISKELVAADFLVKPNQLKFPQSVTQSSLTYSPLINNRNAVNKLIYTMREVGWDIENTRMLFIDNHWYKENSIALMLVPPGVNPQQIKNQQDWANEYTSQNCNTDLTIKLQLDGQYKILNLKSQLLKHGLARGSWNFTHFPYLELTSKTDDWSFYFEVKYYAQKDRVGEVQIFELSPIDKYIFLDNCSFVFGVRQ
jgi:hypothetical protein